MGDKAERWEQIVWQTKFQVMYFSCPSLLREKGEIGGSETLVVVISSLVKCLANICEYYEYLLVYTSLSEHVNIF